MILLMNFILFELRVILNKCKVKFFHLISNILIGIIVSNKNNTNDTPGMKNSKVSKTRNMRDNIWDNSVKLNLNSYYKIHLINYSKIPF